MKQATLLPTKQLLPNPSNPRTITKAKLDKLVQSLRQFPQMLHLRPIVVESLENPVVLGGNMRLKALQQLGVEEVPVLTAEELTPEQRAEFIIKDNVGFGDWDWEVLANEWDPLELSDWGLDIPDLPELKAEVEEDEIPEPPTDPLTKPGDLWILGKHRLLCGDCTQRNLVDYLMDGQAADLCFTSPPYALGKSISLSGNSKMSKKGKAYELHDDNPDQWYDLMNNWLEISKNIVTDIWVVNVQLLAGNKRDLVRWLNNNVSNLIDVITWDKGNAQPAMASGVLSSRFEWLICLGKTGATRAFPLSTWRGTLSNVYEGPPQRKNEFSEIHAATMPIHLPQFVISTLCNQSQIIYEPFCGSGTTLIACEQLGRTCYGMELDPKYCDVIVARWEKLTGKQAVRSYNINDHDQKETDATA